MQICLSDLKNVINPPRQVLLNNWKDNDISVKPKGENLNQKKEKKERSGNSGFISSGKDAAPHLFR